ncbi:MAG: DUF4976 domain-containing protein, partial [Planctomycetota bacterium]|nr:DUF4976 domain-containing protein [Planctomycetota bacterium]
PPGPVDGRSLVPLLKQSGTFEREALFWHYPHYWSSNRVRPYGVVRAGDWKLIEHYEDGRLELFNLAKDIGETTDLSGADPKRAARMARELASWRRESFKARR